jgi:hypothetical protein
MHAGELGCEHRLGVAGGVDESVHGLDEGGMVVVKMWVRVLGPQENMNGQRF